MTTLSSRLVQAQDARARGSPWNNAAVIPRVRFAPSPTGYLHVGGARTALFNWLYARRHGGTFVLRIEDTDVERSSAEMIDGILDGLRWLGLDWDEGPEVGGPHGPYFQSQRLDRYRQAVEQLVAEDRAYYCYCAPARLQQERERAEGRGEAWQYDRTCLALTAEDVAELERGRAPRAVRFKVPLTKTVFTDSVRGRIEFDSRSIEDFVVLRSDRHPTYHLSVVVDDLDMGITHVIRGDDHLSNTPKHLLLFEALGAEPPVFAHVPLILGTDKKRLSKRHGATSVTEYRAQGYLPSAMVNFLALLGWSPGDDSELMSTAELVERFSLDGISGGNAVFDTTKLDWMNGQYIATLPVEELLASVGPLLVAASLTPSADMSSPDGSGHTGPWIHRLLDLLRPRAKRLTDFVELARPFLVETVAYDTDAVAKHLSLPDLRDHVAALAAALRTLDPFDEAHVEAVVRETAAARGIKAGALIHATRVATTGRTTSPGIFEVLVLLGRTRSVERLEQLVDFLGGRS
jgi:glutamyl-tRNA synthetase